MSNTSDGGYSQDVLTRIYNVSWGGDQQQGLLAEYPPGPGAPVAESIQDVMKGTPIAYALDSGLEFAGVNMGASGLGYTVLTRGLVCFGSPSDGDACFIAAPGFQYYSGGSDALQRGVIGDAGKIAWTTTESGAGSENRLIALSFAQGAFFAVYTKPAGGSIIATSFNGVDWETADAAFGNEAMIGGAVAAIGEGETVSYVSCGAFAQERKDLVNFVSNLVSAVSRDGKDWETNSNTGEMAEPGVGFGIINNYACTVAGGSVLAKPGDEQPTNVIVAAAAGKTLIVDPDAPLSKFGMLTAAAAMSTTGDSWELSKIGLEAGLDQISFGLAVVFVSGDNYFLMSDHEYITGEEGHEVAKSHLYKSVDGGWAKIRTNINWMSTLSAIDKDLDVTKIVNL